jgi:hypothetical protein
MEIETDTSTARPEGGAAPAARRTLRWAAVLGAVAGAIGLVGLTVARAEPPAEGNAPAAAPAGKTPRSTVKVVIKTVPPKRATVSWGKKKLGVIMPGAPLTIPRPRDSGPMDLVVRADGCVPVHTRAYTFTDSVMAVKVTPVEEKNTIYGYREELPPDGGVPDSGSPPSSSIFNR